MNSIFFSSEWNSHNMASESTHRLINSTGLHFDVIINEEFFADSFLMFAHKFKAPVVTICELKKAIAKKLNFPEN